MNVKKSNFKSYIYTLFLDHFCAQTVVVRWNLCKLRSSEKLLTNMFGHKVKQLSSWPDIHWKLLRPIKAFVYPRRLITTMSHFQLTFGGVWSQLVWNGLSKESQLPVRVNGFIIVNILHISYFTIAGCHWCLMDRFRRTWSMFHQVLMNIGNGVH